MSELWWRHGSVMVTSRRRYCTSCLRTAGCSLDQTRAVHRGRSQFPRSACSRSDSSQSRWNRHNGTVSRRHRRKDSFSCSRIRALAKSTGWTIQCLLTRFNKMRFILDQNQLKNWKRAWFCLDIWGHHILLARRMLIHVPLDWFDLDGRNFKFWHFFRMRSATGVWIFWLGYVDHEILL